MQRFISRINKQIESICCTASVSEDFDEMVEIHIGVDGEIYLEEVLLPYLASDVVRICHKYDEDYEDDSYVRMYFGNGDWLSISLLCDYKAKINGVIYYDKDVVSTYYSITNKKLEQYFSTPKEVLEKINQCAEKADVWIDVSAEEDEDSEIWFDDNEVLWIDNNIRTPYMLENIDSVAYQHNFMARYVRINLKTDKGYELINLCGDGRYQICVSPGDMPCLGEYDCHEEIINQYQSIINAKNGELE